MYLKSLSDILHWAFNKNISCIFLQWFSITMKLVNFIQTVHWTHFCPCVVWLAIHKTRCYCKRTVKNCVFSWISKKWGKIKTKVHFLQSRQSKEIELKVMALKRLVGMRHVTLLHQFYNKHTCICFCCFPCKYSLTSFLLVPFFDAWYRILWKLVCPQTAMCNDIVSINLSLDFCKNE